MTDGNEQFHDAWEAAVDDFERHLQDIRSRAAIVKLLAGRLERGQVGDEAIGRIGKQLQALVLSYDGLVIAWTACGKFESEA